MNTQHSENLFCLCDGCWQRVAHVHWLRVFGFCCHIVAALPVIPLGAIDPITSLCTCWAQAPFQLRLPVCSCRDTTAYTETRLRSASHHCSLLAVPITTPNPYSKRARYW